MIKVPEHIIDLYRFDVESYPCISYIKIGEWEILKSLLNKSITIWYFADDNQDKSLIIEEFLQYDKTGIYIYYRLNENNEYEVFILSKIDKRDIVNFTLHIIKKQIKNYGNNGERITGKD